MLISMAMTKRVGKIWNFNNKSNYVWNEFPRDVKWYAILGSFIQGNSKGCIKNTASPTRIDVDVLVRKLCIQTFYLQCCELNFYSFIYSVQPKSGRCCLFHKLASMMFCYGTGFLWGELPVCNVYRFLTLVRHDDNGTHASSDVGYSFVSLNKFNVMPVW